MMEKETRRDAKKKSEVNTEKHVQDTVLYR